MLLGVRGRGDRNAIELGEINNSKIAIVLVRDTSPISFCFFWGCRSRPDRSFRIPKRSVVRGQPRQIFAKPCFSAQLHRLAQRLGLKCQNRMPFASRTKTRTAGRPAAAVDLANVDMCRASGESYDCRCRVPIRTSAAAAPQSTSPLCLRVAPTSTTRLSPCASVQKAIVTCARITRSSGTERDHPVSEA